MSIEEETRRESYHKTLGELGPRTKEVYLLISKNPGITAWEISRHVNRFVHAVRPRITELKKAGMIVASGSKLFPPTGRHEAGWTVIVVEEDKNKGRTR